MSTIIETLAAEKDSENNTVKFPPRQQQKPIDVAYLSKRVIEHFPKVLAELAK